MNPKKDEADHLRKGRRGRTTKQGATPAAARKIAARLEKSAKRGWPFGGKKS